MFAKELKEILAQVDDAAEIEIVSGFQILDLADVYTQGQLLDYLVRPSQMDARSFMPQQRRDTIKQNARCIEWVENHTLWHNSVFLLAVAPDTTVQEQP